MTEPDDSNERWFRDVLDGRRLPAPEEPEEPPPPPSFHGGPRLTALVQPDPSAVMNSAIRRAAAGLPPERRPAPGHRG